MGEAYSYNLNKISFIVVLFQFKIPLKLVQTCMLHTLHCFIHFVFNISFRFEFLVVLLMGSKTRGWFCVCLYYSIIILHNNK